MLIEGNYRVRDGSPITYNAQVDESGMRLAVSNGSAYDLFPTRNIHHANIVRIPTADAVPAFEAQRLEVVVQHGQERATELLRD